VNIQTKHIVYVEDDPDIRELFKEELEGCGYQVTAFEEGGTALSFVAAASTHQVACVISDFRMPGMNGGELLDQLLKSGYKRPFILLSGDIELETQMKERAEEIYFELVSKPCSIKELRAALERAFAAPAMSS
jgi:CheY-like chemotaxis protein